MAESTLRKAAGAVYVGTNGEHMEHNAIFDSAVKCAEMITDADARKLLLGLSAVSDPCGVYVAKRAELRECSGLTYSRIVKAERVLKLCGLLSHRVRAGFPSEYRLNVAKLRFFASGSESVQ